MSCSYRRQVKTARGVRLRSSPPLPPGALDRLTGRSRWDRRAASGGTPVRVPPPAFAGLAPPTQPPDFRVATRFYRRQEKPHLSKGAASPVLPYRCLEPSVGRRHLILEGPPRVAWSRVPLLVAHLRVLNRDSGSRVACRERRPMAYPPCGGPSKAAWSAVLSFTQQLFDQLAVAGA